VILAVAHNEFKSMPLEKKPNQVIYDVKGMLNPALIDGRL